VRQVDEYNGIRLRLTAEMADASNTVKEFVIKAEDARILGDMPTMRRVYTDLAALNNELIGEYVKRSTNHQVRAASVQHCASHWLSRVSHALSLSLALALPSPVRSATSPSYAHAHILFFSFAVSLH
jgi:hypothetical protein